MMPVIDRVMLAAGSSLAASIVVKMTITTAVGLIAAWLARGNRAAVRHALLAAMFGAILLLPIVSVVMPPFHVDVPAGTQSQTALPQLVTGIDAKPSIATAGIGTRVTPVAAQVSKLSLSALLLAGWAVGTALFLLPVVIGLCEIRSLRRSGLPWLRGQSILETLALEAGMKRRVEVLLQEAAPGPMTCGVAHPAIFLPRDAESWSQEDLNRALAHELEHVRRGDSISRCLARVAGAMYWFHPMVWIAWRRLVLEAERSCDDAALRHSEATAYADQLVGLAKRLLAAQGSPLLAMANRADLAKRVSAVLDNRQRRGRAGSLWLALACAAALVFVFGLSSLTLDAAPPNAATAATPEFDVAAIHPHKPVPHEHSHIVTSSGTFTTVNVDLKSIIQWAYDLPASRIVGGPPWLGSARWDINAKAENAMDTQKSYDPKAPKLEKRQMVQALLADRFHLTVHREMRELPIYTLVVAKGGPKLLAAQAKGTQVGGANGRIEVDGGDDTMAVLAEQLAETLGRF